jgi:two-component sensor histidine kinase
VPLALVLNELVCNAVKHSTEPVAAVAIAVTAKNAPAALRIEIRNRGRLAACRGARSDASGLGLGLVAAMMPPRGASFELREAAGCVYAVLTLSTTVAEPCTHPETMDDAPGQPVLALENIA